MHAHTKRISEILLMNGAQHLGADVCTAPDAIDGESLFDEGGIIANPLIKAVTETEEELRTLVVKALPHNETECVGSICCGVAARELDRRDAARGHLSGRFDATLRSAKYRWAGASTR